MTDDNTPHDPTPPDPMADPAAPVEPTQVMPAAAGGPPPRDPNTAIPNDQPDPRWYDDKAVVGAVIAIGLLGLFLLIAWLLWWSDDDDDQDLVVASTTTAVIVEGSTVTTPSSTIPQATITEGSTIEVTLPSSTAPTTAAPTTAPPTTVAPTTAPPTTVAPTTAPPTTAPPTTTTSIPVVTVPPTDPATVFDVIASSPDLSRLSQLIDQAGLAAELDGAGPVTLFAPSNPAIETLEAAPGGAELLADPDQVRALLLRHVVPQALTSSDVFAVTELTTASGETLVVDGAAQTVDGSSLIVTDVVAENGVIQVVDRVLLSN